MAIACGVAILSGGQIVVAGTNPNGHVGPEFVVARLTSSGALDTTFGPNGQGYNYTTISSTTMFADDVDALGLDASGDLLVGGMWLNPTTGATVDQVVRYTPAGLIDTSFATQGVYDLPFGLSGGIQGIGFQSNGQIILGYFLNPTRGDRRRHPAQSERDTRHDVRLQRLLLGPDRGRRGRDCRAAQRRNPVRDIIQRLWQRHSGGSIAGWRFA